MLYIFTFIQLKYVSIKSSHTYILFLKTIKYTIKIINLFIRKCIIIF